MADFYVDKIYEIVSKNDDYKYVIRIDDDFTYIDYYERPTDTTNVGEYRRIKDAHQEISSDICKAMAECIVEHYKEINSCK